MPRGSARPTSSSCLPLSGPFVTQSATCWSTSRSSVVRLGLVEVELRRLLGVREVQRALLHQILARVDVRADRLLGAACRRGRRGLRLRRTGVTACLSWWHAATASVAARSTWNRIMTLHFVREDVAIATCSRARIRERFLLVAVSTRKDADADDLGHEMAAQFERSIRSVKQIDELSRVVQHARHPRRRSSRAGCRAASGTRLKQLPPSAAPHRRERAPVHPRSARAAAPPRRRARSRRRSRAPRRRRARGDDRGSPSCARGSRRGSPSSRPARSIRACGSRSRRRARSAARCGCTSPGKTQRQIATELGISLGARQQAHRRGHELSRRAPGHRARDRRRDDGASIARCSPRSRRSRRRAGRRCSRRAFPDDPALVAQALLWLRADSTVADDAAPPSLGDGDERYELSLRLDAGATAAVWQAFDRKLGRNVAIKVFHSEHAEARRGARRGARRVRRDQRPRRARARRPRARGRTS